jgi:hypothetical protein
VAASELAIGKLYLEAEDTKTDEPRILYLTEDPCGSCTPRSRERLSDHLTAPGSATATDSASPASDAQSSGCRQSAPTRLKKK